MFTTKPTEKAMSHNRKIQKKTKRETVLMVVVLPMAVVKKQTGKPCHSFRCRLGKAPGTLHIRNVLSLNLAQAFLQGHFMGYEPQ